MARQRHEEAQRAKAETQADAHQWITASHVAIAAAPLEVFDAATAPSTVIVQVIEPLPVTLFWADR